MSRSIQPGDFVRIQDEQGESNDYLIKSIHGLNIDIHPFDDPESISRIIMTSQGPRIEGYQGSPLAFEWFMVGSEEPPTIQTMFTPKVDDSSWYKPLVPLRRFDFRTVKDWINSPLVRPNLFQFVSIPITIFGFSDRYKQSVNIRFNSPYRSEYQNYILEGILPHYIRVEEKATNESRIESDLTLQLIRAAFGVLAITSSDIYRIFESIFPQLIIQRVADDGDCYYSSIGLINNFRSRQVRDDLAIGFNQLPSQDQETLVSFSAGGCPDQEGIGLQYAQNPEGVVQQFPDILRTPCGEGRKDCAECLWGGNFLDELVYRVYQLPVISMGIIKKDQPEHVVGLYEVPKTSRLILEFILNQLTPSFWNPTNHILTLPVTQPEVFIGIYPDISKAAGDEMMASNRFIGYIAVSEKHIDGILPKESGLEF